DRAKLSWRRATDLMLGIQPRHAVARQDAVYLRAQLCDRSIDVVFEGVITLAHTHRHVEHHRQARTVDLRRDRRQFEGGAFARRVIAGERSPGDGDVDIAIGDGSDDAGAWIGIAVIAVDGEPAHIAG